MQILCFKTEILHENMHANAQRRHNITKLQRRNNRSVMGPPHPHSRPSRHSQLFPDQISPKCKVFHLLIILTSQISDHNKKSVERLCPIISRNLALLSLLPLSANGLDFSCWPVTQMAQVFRTQYGQVLNCNAMLQTRVYSSSSCFEKCEKQSRYFLTGPVCANWS